MGCGDHRPGNPEAFAGVPGGAQGTLWYYNKALFEAAGLDPETPPATWAEFEEACTKLAEAGTTPLGMSGIDGNLLWWGWLSFSPQFFTTAEEVLKVRSGEIKLNDERFLQSLQPIASTYDKGWWNEDYASKKFADIEAAFGAGQMGIVPGLITSAMNWKAFDGTLGDGNYGVFPSPLVDGGLQQGQFFNPVLLYAISKGADDVETSRSWISAIVSKEGQEMMLEQSGQFPNRTDVDVTTLANSQGATRIKEIVEAGRRCARRAEPVQLGCARCGDAEHHERGCVRRPAGLPRQLGEPAALVTGAESRSNEAWPAGELAGHARWIGRDPAAVEEVEPRYPDDRPGITLDLSPPDLLRAEVAVRPGVRRAEVLATARGLFRCWIDGQRVGDDELAPGWTDYRVRVPVRRYDVTDLVAAASGRLCWSAVVADGWYCGYVGMDRRRQARWYGTAPSIRAALRIDYDDDVEHRRHRPHLAAGGRGHPLRRSAHGRDDRRDL